MNVFIIKGDELRYLHSRLVHGGVAVSFNSILGVAMPEIVEEESTCSHSKEIPEQGGAGSIDHSVP